jgi:colanic acid/amylovoran biosynthesis protein
MGVDALAMDLGKPVILWGASVGPFEREPLFVAAIARHLGRMSLNAVRESVSYDYLTKVLGLKNVIRMADPAFTLVKQEVDIAAFWPDDQGNGAIGLNISPLIEKFKHAGQDLRVEAVQFVRHVVQKMNYGVLLVPHVVPSDNAPGNNDAHYMRMIGDACGDLGGAVRIMPSAFNAAQIKYVISQLRFFIGARTHATIAALSSGVPTISIAYSVKARGINRDLFGHEETVLPTPEVSSQTLVAALNLLVRNEADFRTALRKKIPEYEAMIRAAVVKIKDLTRGDACG